VLGIKGKNGITSFNSNIPKKEEKIKFHNKPSQQENKPIENTNRIYKHKKAPS
jgi:hypothetical protein